MEDEKTIITPEKVIKILKKHGTIISIEEAKKVLDFYKKFAKLWLNEVFRP
jgi:hypothetical protein